MKQLVKKALDNRNRIATAALATSGIMAANLAGAQTMEGNALVTSGRTAAETLMSSGGPGIFAIVGLSVGAIWLLNRLRSVG